MNWNEIKGKYPKALHKYVVYRWDGDEHYKTDNYAPIVLKDLHRTNPRDLYDFFDESGIIVTIRYISSLKAFRYRIHIGGKITDWRPTAKNPSEIKSRTEAETEAFNKAFELLEKELT